MGFENNFFSKTSEAGDHEYQQKSPARRRSSDHRAGYGSSWEGGTHLGRNPFAAGKDTSSFSHRDEEELEDHDRPAMWQGGEDWYHLNLRVIDEENDEHALYPPTEQGYKSHPRYCEYQELLDADEKPGSAEASSRPESSGQQAGSSRPGEMKPSRTFTDNKLRSCKSSLTMALQNNGSKQFNKTIELQDYNSIVNTDHPQFMKLSNKEGNNDVYNTIENWSKNGNNAQKKYAQAFGFTV